MAGFVNRMIRAAKLDVSLYEEVEADSSALGPAMGVAILSAVAGGIGTLRVSGASGIPAAALAALVGWFIWAGLTYLIGTQVVPEPQTRSDLGELLRTIGFASSPGVLRVLGIIPGLAGLVNVLVGFWMLVAMVIAVRQALDYQSTMRAFGVCFVGWLVQAVVLVLFLPAWR